MPTSPSQPVLQCSKLSTSRRQSRSLTAQQGAESTATPSKVSSFPSRSTHCDLEPVFGGPVLAGASPSSLCRSLVSPNSHMNTLPIVPRVAAAVRASPIGGAVRGREQTVHTCSGLLRACPVPHRTPWSTHFLHFSAFR